MVISSNNIIRQLSVPWAATKVLLSGENKKKIYTSLILTQKITKTKHPYLLIDRQSLSLKYELKITERAASLSL